MTPKIPPAPKGLTARSRRLWTAILTDFEMAPAEVATLEQALRLLDRADEAAGIVAAAGMITEDRYGCIRAHPMLDVEVRCRRQYVDMTRMLGVRFDEPTPSRATTGAKTGPKPRRAPLRSAQPMARLRREVPAPDELADRRTGIERFVRLRRLWPEDPEHARFVETFDMLTAGTAHDDAAFVEAAEVALDRLGKLATAERFIAHENASKARWSTGNR
jgi:hypothetical protein